MASPAGKNCLNWVNILVKKKRKNQKELPHSSLKLHFYSFNSFLFFFLHIYYFSFHPVWLPRFWSNVTDSTIVGMLLPNGSEIRMSKLKSADKTIFA